MAMEFTNIITVRSLFTHTSTCKQLKVSCMLLGRKFYNGLLVVRDRIGVFYIFNFLTLYIFHLNALNGTNAHSLQGF